MHTKTDLWRVYQDLCQRVENLYTARTWMLRHLIAYLAGMAAMRSTLLMSGADYGTLAHIGVMLAGVVWTAGVLIHLSGYVLYELQERSIAAQVGVLAVEVARVSDETTLALQREIAPVQFYDEHGRIIPNG